MKKRVFAQIYVESHEADLNSSFYCTFAPAYILVLSLNYAPKCFNLDNVSRLLNKHGPKASYFLEKTKVLIILKWPYFNPPNKHNNHKS